MQICKVEYSCTELDYSECKKLLLHTLPDKEGVVESRVFQVHTWQRMIVLRILDGIDGWIDFSFISWVNIECIGCGKPFVSPICLVIINYLENKVGKVQLWWIIGRRFTHISKKVFTNSWFMICLSPRASKGPSIFILNFERIQNTYYAFHTYHAYFHDKTLRFWNFLRNV